eukprot:scaffold17239_cov20-Prasinocladus_malaysianus.AAC.2
MRSGADNRTHSCQSTTTDIMHWHSLFDERADNNGKSSRKGRPFETLAQLLNKWLICKVIFSTCLHHEDVSARSQTDIPPFH